MTPTFRFPVGTLRSVDVETRDRVERCDYGPRSCDVCVIHTTMSHALRMPTTISRTVAVATAYKPIAALAAIAIAEPTISRNASIGIPMNQIQSRTGSLLCRHC